MGDYRDFGYEGKTGTCLWCGHKLTFKRVMAHDADKDNPTYKVEGAHFATKRAEQAGGYQDDSFCGLRCGYQFGLRLASLGRRLIFERST